VVNWQRSRDPRFLDHVYTYAQAIQRALTGQQRCTLTLLLHKHPASRYPHSRFLLNHGYMRPILGGSSMTNNLHRVLFYPTLSLIVLTILHSTSILIILSTTHTLAEETGGTRLVTSLYMKKSIYMYIVGLCLHIQTVTGLGRDEVYRFRSRGSSMAVCSLRPSGTRLRLRKLALWIRIPNITCTLSLVLHYQLIYFQDTTSASKSPCCDLRYSALTTIGLAMISASRMYDTFLLADSWNRRGVLTAL
jgi:hypothetical protein